MTKELVEYDHLVDDALFAEFWQPSNKSEIHLDPHTLLCELADC